MATYTNLNLTRLADAALQGFVKALLPLNRFSISFSPITTLQSGTQIVVPIVGSLTATTFGGTYAVCGGTKTVATVAITKHRIVTVGQQDLDALNNSASALESYGFQQGAALGTIVVEDVLTLVTTANFTSAAQTTAANLDLTQIRAARLALNQANAPKMGRVAIIDSVGYDALLSVSNFLLAQNAGDATALRDARIGRAMNIDFYEYNAPFVSANSVNVFVAHASAIAIAMRYLQPQTPDRYDNARPISDPETGATFGLRDFYDPARGERFIVFECNFGYNIGLTNAGRIIKRTD